MLTYKSSNILSEGALVNNERHPGPKKTTSSCLFARLHIAWWLGLNPKPAKDKVRALSGLPTHMNKGNNIRFSSVKLNKL
jgi:hypothetical protein